MESEIIPFGGWRNNLRLCNGEVELIITLDVGPRVISYRTVNGSNVFKNYTEQIGTAGESEWKIRGGHRFWIAPETELSYTPDNAPVAHEPIPGGARLETELPGGVCKELSVSLAETGSKVTVRHRAVNRGREPVELATWGLSVMAPGGLEIIPLPPLGLHPHDLLPRRVIVPWPYTDMTDPRYRFGSKFITLRQTPEGGSTKLGLLHTEGWVAYLNGETLFVKTIEAVSGAVYPDLGCNFETYTNGEMLEIEALGPLCRLAPGDAVEHTETWALLDGVPHPASLREDDLGAWIAPLLGRV